MTEVKTVLSMNRNSKPRKSNNMNNYYAPKQNSPSIQPMEVAFTPKPKLAAKIQQRRRKNQERTNASNT